MTDFRQQCINVLSDASHKLKSDYGVKSLRLFGSVARGENKESSDIDLFVEMPPKALKVAALKNYLQDLLGRGVDIVRSRSSLDPFLLSEIKKDGITIFA